MSWGASEFCGSTSCCEAAQDPIQWVCAWHAVPDRKKEIATVAEARSFLPEIFINSQREISIAIGRPPGIRFLSQVLLVFYANNVQQPEVDFQSIPCKVESVILTTAGRKNLSDVKFSNRELATNNYCCWAGLGVSMEE